MKIAVKTSPGRVLLLDPLEVYTIEARRDDTQVRTARKTTLKSVNSLADWAQKLAPTDFVRIHRSWLVNIHRVREIRLRKGDTNDWELKLDPPVNAVLPVSRAGYARLSKLLGI